MKEETRSPHAGALPNYQRAVIPRRKLESYLLNPFHSEGKHKARVFKSALGFDRSSADELAQAILTELPYCLAEATQAGPWGQKYEVVLPIVGRNGKTVEVLIVWIIRPETDFPSFVTGYVVGKVNEP